MKTNYILIFSAIVLVGAVVVMIIFHLSPQAPRPVACTQEAKLCSDGSYVGRTAPTCNFAKCPKEDLIVVESPRAFQKVSSPLLITGQARGTWFFEATFPIKLYDANHKLITQTHATATSDWMTQNFVPFQASLPFAVTTEQKGMLVLEKDNPSGLPEHADEIDVPITLSPQ